MFHVGSKLHSLQKTDKEKNERANQMYTDTAAVWAIQRLIDRCIPS